MGLGSSLTHTAQPDHFHLLIKFPWLIIGVVGGALLGIYLFISTAFRGEYQSQYTRIDHGIAHFAHEPSIKTPQAYLALLYT